MGGGGGINGGGAPLGGTGSRDGGELAGTGARGGAGAIGGAGSLGGAGALDAALASLGTTLLRCGWMGAVSWRLKRLSQSTPENQRCFIMLDVPCLPVPRRFPCDVRSFETRSRSEEAAGFTNVVRIARIRR